jgi:hypothetical protein
MKKSNLKVFSVLGFVALGVVGAGYSRSLLAATYVERDGQYEINWSTGKIRFYGVGKFEAAEGSLRAAEQRAWADGLRAAEQNIPILMSSRLGGAEKINGAKLSKLATDTASVSTTYFGDDRVKVMLEAPIQKIAPQLTSTTTASGPVGAPGPGVVIKLGKGAKPSAFVRIVDENGREMVSTNALVAAAQTGAPSIKWFKSEAGPVDGLSAAEAPVISGTSDERGVVRVSSSEWKPIYEAAVTSGAVAFVVK